MSMQGQYVFIVGGSSGIGLATVHRLAAAANVSGLENLANVDDLPATGAWIVALPMKIAGGSGGPLRIVALLPPRSASHSSLPGE